MNVPVEMVGVISNVSTSKARISAAASLATLSNLMAKYVQISTSALATLPSANICARTLKEATGAPVWRVLSWSIIGASTTVHPILHHHHVQSTRVALDIVPQIEMPDVSPTTAVGATLATTTRGQERRWLAIPGEKCVKTNQHRVKCGSERDTVIVLRIS